MADNSLLPLFSGRIKEKTFPKVFYHYISEVYLWKIPSTFLFNSCKIQKNKCQCFPLEEELQSKLVSERLSKP